MPETRLRVRYDEIGAQNQESPTGRSLPESEADYAGNEHHQNGRTIPYAEYIEYYGNPDRHVILTFEVETRCASCGLWKAGAALHDIDFMDDDPWLVGITLPESVYTPEQVAQWPGYAKVIAEELYAEEEENTP